MKPIPSIEECFNMVQQEAQCQVTMLEKRELREVSHVTIASKTTSLNFKSTLSAIKVDEKDELCCIHCNGKRHTKATFFEIHSYPDWFLEKQKQNK